MILPKSWGITFYKKEPWDLERGETEYRIVGVHVNICKGKTLEKYKYWTTVKLYFLYKRGSNIVYINIPMGLWELFKIPYLPKQSFSYYISCYEQTGWLKWKFIFLHFWWLEVSDLAGLISCQVSVPVLNLQMAIFSLYLHMVFLCVSLS